MAILKIEVDTDDIYNEDDYNEISFENLIREVITEETKKEMIKKFAGEAFEKTSKNISLEITHQVTKKLYDLVNEEIVMQDRWGKPTFIGSVEDYIKQQIDKKLLRPVNGNGETLTGCSTTSNVDTWIEYTIQKKIETEMKHTLQRVENNVNSYCKDYVDKTLEDFKNNTLNKLILERLNAAGVKG